MGLSGLVLAAALCAQRPAGPGDEDERRLPNGKLQAEEMLKADHKSNLKDLEQMRKQLDDVEADVKKGEGRVLSMKSLKDLEEIEKLSRRVRARMKRY